MNRNTIETQGRLDIKELSELCHKWSWYLLGGIALIILGTLAIAAAGFTTIISMFLFGILLLIAAVVYGIKAFYTQRWRGFFLNVLMGVFSGVVGAMMVARPELSAVSLTLLLASYFLVMGFFKIIGALAIDLEGWGWILLSGFISLTLGLLIFFSWPASALWVIGLFIGIELLFTGWYFVMLSLIIKQRACAVKA